MEDKNVMGTAELMDNEEELDIFGLISIDWGREENEEEEGGKWKLAEKNWDADNFAIFVFFLDLILFCEENKLIQTWFDCRNKNHNLSKINQFHSWRLKFELKKKTISF